MRWQDDKELIQKQRRLLDDQLAGGKAEPLETIRELAKNIVGKDYETQILVRVLCVLWKHEWAVKHHGRDFKDWDPLLQLCGWVFGETITDSAVKGWEKDLTAILELKDKPPSRKAPPRRSPVPTPVEASFDPAGTPVAGPAAEPEPDEPIASRAPGASLAATEGKGPRILMHAGYLGVIAVATVVGFARGRSADHAPSGGVRAANLHHLAQAVWDDTKPTEVAVALNDPCRAYEGWWMLNGPYVLDPDATDQSRNPLLSKARDADFFAACRADKPGQPAKLVGLDITTADVYEDGHQEERDRLAETVNIVKATITFDKGRPATREIADLQRLKTGDFSGQSPYYDAQRLATHLNSLNELGKATCKIVGEVNETEMTFRCVSTSRRFRYDKALRKSTVAR